MNKEIKKQVDRIWSLFYSFGITNATSILIQTSYLLYLRALEYKQKVLNEFASTHIEESIDFFDASHMHLRWSRLKQLGEVDLFDIVSNDVIPFVNKRFKEQKVDFSSLSEITLLLVPTPKALYELFAVIDEIDFQCTENQGDFYECLLSKFFSEGRYGQSSTPRHIIDMMIQLVEPNANDKIIDPAVGTAGYLVAANEYINRGNAKSLVGYDISSSMIFIGAMNLFFHGLDFEQLLNIDTLGKQYQTNEKYSLVLSNPPLIGKSKYDEISADLLELTKTNRTELLFIISMIHMLDIGGRCAMIVPDGVLFGSSKAHKSIKKEIVDNYKLDAIISLPSGVFLPYTGVSTSIIILSNSEKGNTDNVWFYDMKADGYTLNNKRLPIDGNDIPDIINRYHHRFMTEFERKKSEQSFFVSKEEIIANDYNLFLNKYKEIQLEEMDYDDYSGITFEDLIVQIKSGRQGNSFVEMENAIYIPKLGTSNPVCSISELSIKEQNCFQVELKDIVLNEYLAAMFKSVLGRSLLKMANNGGVIPHINKSSLIQITVPVPDMEVQRQIVDTVSKISILKDTINKFDNEIALNPVSSIRVIEKLDQFVEILGKLTDFDYVKNVIRKGESKVIEFKETFGYDIRKEKQEKYIEKMVLKTIVGFLNTDGGVLLVGVSDEGKIMGIDYEVNKFHKNTDKFLLHFKNKVKEKIGEQFYPLIDYRLTNVDNRLVLIVDCKQSEKPCYLEGSDFYVRTNPATDQLKGPQLVEYCNNHFKH